MTDREKVVNGLEWILNDIKENGHYQVDNYEDEIREALVLLKAHEPRVLTLEEAEKAEVCWLEQRGYEPYVTDDADTWNPEIYGKAYRCWSAMPTDEQRKAVKWE